MIPIIQTADQLSVTNQLLFEVNGKPYVFQGLSGFISELSPLGRAIIKDLKGGSRSFSEVEEQLSGQYGIEEVHSAVEELLQQEVIRLNGRVGSNSRTPGVPQGELPIQTLVFHLVNECNLGCTYCYAGGGEYGAPMKTMNEATAEKAIDFLIEASKNAPNVSVILFGGEPTLNWKLLTHVVEYGKKAAQAAGKRIDFSMTTNGTLLNERRINFLVEHNIGVSISMDGDESTQDTWRPFKTGHGSYALVHKNATKLIEKHRTKPVAARVTLTKDFPAVKETFSHLRQMGFHEVGFAPVSETDEAFILNKPELSRLLDEFEELTDMFIEEARQDRYFGFSNLVNVLVELHTGVNKSYGCGAGIGFYAVSPSGDLFLCHRFNEQYEYKMGDIYSGVDRVFQKTLLESLHVDNKTTCSRCPLKHTCSGGCYYEAKERQGEITSPNLHYCNWMYRWYSIALKAYVQIMEDNPTFLDRIAGLPLDDCHAN